MITTPFLSTDLPRERSEALYQASRGYIAAQAKGGSLQEQIARVKDLAERCDAAYRTANGDRLTMEMAPRSTFARLSEANSTTIDGISMVRNSVNTAGALLPAANVAGAVGGMVIAGGALGVVSGLCIMKNAAGDAKTAYDHGNVEGGARAATMVAIGGTYGSVSGSMLVYQGATYAGKTALAAGGAAALTAGGFAMYGIIAVYAGYGLAINHIFRHELNEALGEGRSGEDLAKALLFLDEKVRPENSKELQKKWDQFATRSSEAACRLVREQVTPDLLERLINNDPKAKEDAAFIITEVKRANDKQILKNRILMAIAIVGITAFVLATLFATGPFGPLLFAIGAALWLLIDNSAIGQKFLDWRLGDSQIPQDTATPNIAERVEKAGLQAWGAAF